MISRQGSWKSSGTQSSCFMRYPILVRGRLISKTSTLCFFGQVTFLFERGNFAYNLYCGEQICSIVFGRSGENRLGDLDSKFNLYVLPSTCWESVLCECMSPLLTKNIFDTATSKNSIKSNFKNHRIHLNFPFSTAVYLHLLFSLWFSPLVAHSQATNHAFTVPWPVIPELGVTAPPP